MTWKERFLCYLRLTVAVLKVLASYVSRPPAAPPVPYAFTVDVRCRRCDGEHESLGFRLLNNPTDSFDHYGYCPATGQPVLLLIEDARESFGYREGDVNREPGQVGTDEE